MEHAFGEKGCEKLVSSISSQIQLQLSDGGVFAIVTRFSFLVNKHTLLI